MKTVGSKFEVFHQLALRTKKGYFKRDLYYDNKLKKVRVIRNSVQVGAGTILPKIFDFQLVKKDEEEIKPDDEMTTIEDGDVDNFKLKPLLSKAVIKEYNEHVESLEQKFKSIQDIKDVKKLDVLYQHKDTFESKWVTIKDNITNVKDKIASAKSLHKKFNNVDEIESLYKKLESESDDIDNQKRFRKQVFYLHKRLDEFNSEEELLRSYRFAKEFKDVDRHDLIKRMAVVQNLMSTFKESGKIDMQLFRLMFDLSNYLDLLEKFDDEEGHIKSLFKFFYILRPYKSIKGMKDKVELSHKLNETNMTERLEDLGFYIENGMGEKEIHVVKIGISIFNSIDKEFKGYSEFDITNNEGKSQIVITPKKDDTNFTFLNIKDTIEKMYKDFVPAEEKNKNHTIKIRFYYQLSPNEYEQVKVKSMEVRSLNYTPEHRNFIFQLNINFPQIYYIKLE